MKPLHKIAQEEYNEYTKAVLWYITSKYYQIYPSKYYIMGPDEIRVVFEDYKSFLTYYPSQEDYTFQRWIDTGRPDYNHDPKYKG